MRDGAGPHPPTRSQGLPQLPLGYIKKRLKDLEVTERRQVGEAEALVNQGAGSGDSGFFNHAGEM